MALKHGSLHGENAIPDTALREISCLRALKHPNIIELQDVVHSDHHLVLVLPFCDHDLTDYISSRNGSLEPATIRSFKFQLLAGVRHCHENNIIHRDLKAKNLLIQDGELRIADFGLARASAGDVTTFNDQVGPTDVAPLGTY